MSANGTIVTNEIKPFKGTGMFRSSPAVDKKASKQKFLDNYAANNFSDDLKPDIKEDVLRRIEPVESCKATPECTIYNYIIPDDLLKDPSNSGKNTKIERRIFNEAQQASKVARVNEENSSNVGSLNTTIQSKDQIISEANRNIENLETQISNLKKSKWDLENQLKLKSLVQPVAPTLTSYNTGYTNLTNRPAYQQPKPDFDQLVHNIKKKLTILTRLSTNYVPPISIRDYAKLPHNAKDNYFLFVNKLDMTKYLVGYDMRFTEFYENGSNTAFKYPDAIQFSSIWGRVYYCSISKLENFYYFITPLDGPENTEFKLLYLDINNMRTHYEEEFKKRFSGSEIDFKTHADLNPDESRIQKKITGFNRNYKGLVPYAGTEPRGGTQKRNRKTLKRITKKPRRKQLKTHRRKGRREKRKLTKRR